MRGAAGSIVLAVVVAAGCAIGLGDPVVPASSCENVPFAACQEQVQQVARGLTGIDEILIQCGVAPCTRAGGSGLAEIRFSNGQKVTRAWSYVGDAGPVPVVTCVGVAQGPCGLALEGEVELISPSKHVAAATVTCTSAECTPAEGRVTVHIVLGDGSVEDHVTGWSTDHG